MNGGAPARRQIGPLLTAPRFDAPPPLSLYVHVPWCTRKCPYCDFNSHEIRGHGAPGVIPERDYLAALLADLEQDLPAVWGRPVESIFIGGGTPSLLSPAIVDRLLSGLRALLPLRPGLEITLEANPGTVDRGRLAELRGAGVNRLSIGVQSLDDAMLARIGRIHDAGAARAAAEGAAAAGFESWNIDLMYGLPGQSPSEALADLRAALALGAPHVSHYQLTIEPNTAFHSRPPRRVDDDGLWEMQLRCQEALAAAGYEQYEVSAYAYPEAQCRHNLNYWRFGDYLGIGAGAHAKITVAAEQAIHRISKVRHPRDYLARAGGAERIAERRTLAADDVALEFMMNALRLNEGFERQLFQERTGLPLAALESPLARAEALGLIERDHVRLWPTARGRRYLDELLLLFMPDE